MAQIDLLKRYLDAGMAFTHMTQKKAEAIVKDLVKTGEVSANDAGRRVDELVERSRKNTDGLRDIVRSEVVSQISKLGLVPKKDLDAVKRELADLKAKQSKTVVSPAKASAPPKKAAPVKKTVKKATAKKATLPTATSPTATSPTATLPTATPEASAE